MGTQGSSVRSIAALAIGAALLFPAVAAAAPDRVIAVSTSQPADWQGPAQVASNGQTDGEPCGKSSNNYCDSTLLNVAAPSGDATLTVNVDDFSTPIDDFDLVVYKSNAAGDRGEKVGSSGNVASMPESVTVPHASGFYLVRVVYFQTTGSYHGHATLTVAPPTPAVPDVDTPPGVESSLASNPDLGIRSHSEPHIAQSPTNPNILIAGSKQYNRDPDSLKEYEFKIGTYASFDRGRTWRDLGQMDVCPLSEAPPASWPDNTCYPAEDPNAGGMGAEDANDPRGHTDRAEEYITSDIWMGFDDEGNAYAMILDSPDFADGAGWGMAMHKWDTPSPADIQAGRTWGPKVAINEYEFEKGNTAKGGPTGTDNQDNGSNPLGFLDDKNTFAVNNAGPDGDGKTGIILACWGQNVATLIKQQTVCERSTDAGKSFPGEPVPVSGEQQLVLGVNVVADRKDPNTFYVLWKSYASSVAAQLIFGSLGEGENDDLGTGIGSRPVVIYSARTVDGGQTYSPAIPVANYNELASPLPGSRFRTGAIPVGAQAPDGTLYLVYDAYNDAPQQGDSDGKTADAMLIKSTDGGTTFSAPVKVNQDDTNADQFQAHVAVADDGQLNVAFFDRRHDPANLYVDEYLARSDNEGRTFKEARLSHDLSDPSINPPISGSGEFFGDYQGLVADSCQALAFYQDTHLANDPGRDPDFDKGAPRSQFQEVFAYRAPRPEAADDPLCAKPSAAAGSAPFLNPGGRPGNTVCLASAPRSSISRPALRASRRTLRVSGRALDLECLRQRLPGRVRLVQLSVSRKAGKRCVFLQRTGKLSKRRSCRKPLFVKAKLGRVRRGKVPWTFRHSARLRPGKYTVRARARDTRGNVEKLARRYNRKSFRVR
jgi:hypothetical protein